MWVETGIALMVQREIDFSHMSSKDGLQTLSKPRPSDSPVIQFSMKHPELANP